MSDCIFCSVVARQLSGSIVFEDDATSAFLDLHPITAGHTLVVPKRHAANLADLSPQTGGQLFATAMSVGAALRKSGLKCDGISLYLADGEVAGQDVFHVHLHVVPRFRGDGFGHRFPPEYPREAPREELDDVAEKIRNALPR